MDNSVNNDRLEKIEEIVLFVVLTVGLLFMVLHWK